MNIRALFADFTGRQEALNGILRYSLYAPVFYRSSVYDHSERVSWLIRAIEPVLKNVFGATFNTKRCELLALVHDDIEMIIGDIQMGNKAMMNPKQLAEVARQEQEAIIVLEKQFPRMLGNYSYAELLHEAIDAQSTEALLMKYADKFDGFCEALHELYAGNTAMTVNVVNEYGTIPTPYEYYIPFFQEYRQQHPESAFLFDSEHPFFQTPADLDVHAIVQRGSLHTQQTIQEPVGHPQYDWWKGVIQQYADPGRKQQYSAQKEF